MFCEMKQYLIPGLALLLALTACSKEADYEDDGVIYGKRKMNYWLRSPKGTKWQQSDVVGVFSVDDANSKFTISNLPEGKEQLGWFSGPLTAATEVRGAYYPYSAAAGQDPARIAVSVSANAVNGTSPARFDMAAFQKGKDVPLVFQKKLSTLKISFSNVDDAWSKDEPLSSIVVTGQREMTGRFTADLTRADAALEPVQAARGLTIDMRNAKLTSDLTARAAMAATWKKGDVIEVAVKRSRVEGDEIDDFKKVSLTLEADAVEGEELALTVNAPDLDPVLPSLSLEWASPVLGLEDGAATSEIRGNYPAVDQSGNVYVQLARGTDKLYKLNAADGSIAWSRPLGYTLDNNASPSCEPDGSVIYAAGGSSGSGRVVAVGGSNGSVKWTFTSDKFFGNGNTPAPNFNQTAPAIGDNNLYVGNAGTTGSVLAINKNTGNRVAYVSDAADGTGGPVGGVMSGLAMTSGGQVAWLCNYGMFTAERSKLDNPSKTHTTYGAYTTWAERFSHGWTYNSSRSGVACSKIDGQDAVWAAVMELTTGGQYNMHVIVSKVTAGRELSYTAKAFTKDYVRRDIASQDQGGIVIGPQGEAIVSLKGTPGGIFAVSPAGEEVYAYTLPGEARDVCGSCAVDNAGRIHVVADYASSSDANYYILRPDYATGQCKLIVSANLTRLMKDAGVNMGTDTNVRCWSSVVIGADGRVYLAITQFKESDTGAWSDHKARVLCLKYTGVTGPSSVSPWPQKGADASHTGRQK